jgi:hypothetical protein
MVKTISARISIEELDVGQAGADHGLRDVLVVALCFLLRLAVQTKDLMVVNGEYPLILSL